MNSRNILLMKASSLRLSSPEQTVLLVSMVEYEWIDQPDITYERSLEVVANSVV